MTETAEAITWDDQELEMIKQKVTVSPWKKPKVFAHV